MIARFKNLGHSKKTFSAEIKDVSYEELYRVAKPYLLSRDIDFYYDDEKQKGTVVVGLFRQVGEFEVVGAENERL